MMTTTESCFLGPSRCEQSAGRQSAPESSTFQQIGIFKSYLCSLSPNNSNSTLQGVRFRKWREKTQLPTLHEALYSHFSYMNLQVYAFPILLEMKGSKRLKNVPTKQQTVVK